MNTKFLLSIVTILIGVAAVVAGTGMLARPYTFHGSLIDPPLPAADFALTDQNGQPFRLSDQKGHVVVFFFGYTHCPDACPTTLAQFKRVHTQLGNMTDRVRFALVTVDPDRDTPERMKEYLAEFDPSFIGLTGDPDRLKAIWHDYGVYEEKRPGHTPAEDLIDHTSRIYVVDASGKLRAVYSYEVDVDDLAQDTRHLAGEI